jgi:glycosyltransferase involved in cell wall biosynthesis
MRVLQIGKFYPPHWGGMETALKDICESLASQVDFEVVVANSDGHRKEEVRGGIAVTRLANFKTLFSQPLTPSLFGELRRRRADIVHLHEPNPLGLAAFLASGNPARLIIHYHSDIVRQRLLFHLYRPILERGLARAEAIVVGSPQLRDSSLVLRRWRHKCVVVPFGIDLRPFLALSRARRLDYPVQVLAVGRLSYYKGFQYLIRAAQQVDIRVVIAGAGEMEKELRTLVDKLGLQERVQLVGRVSEERLLELYAESQVFCLPSCEPSEAFGLAMVEGMAAGLPVVSTDLPTGVRLVNRDGETGLVVPPADSDELGRALHKLAADPGLRYGLGAAGRARAQSLFARDVMGQAILDIYRRTSPAVLHPEVTLS